MLTPAVRSAAAFILAVRILSPLQAQTVPETPHLKFVTEFIRELAAIENLRAAPEQENKPDDQDNAFANAIYLSTRMQIELRSQIATLKTMRLNGSFDRLIPSLIGFYERKVPLYGRFININTAFLGNPKPDVDYGKLAAEVPKLRAELDFIDESLLRLTPLVFATLVDMKPDSQNHVSHLIITKADRAQLLTTLETAFGSKLDQKDPTFTVAAAVVLKAGLLKDFKSSDEPWE
jgi:hypothetical protein